MQINQYEIEILCIYGYNIRWGYALLPPAPQNKEATRTRGHEATKLLEAYRRIMSLDPGGFLGKPPGLLEPPSLGQGEAFCTMGAPQICRRVLGLGGGDTGGGGH